MRFSEKRGQLRYLQTIVHDIANMRIHGSHKLLLELPIQSHISALAFSDSTIASLGKMSREQEEIECRFLLESAPSLSSPPPTAAADIATFQKAPASSPDLSPPSRRPRML